MACTRRLPEPRTPDGASQPPPVSCSRRLRLIDEAAHIVCDRESTAVDRILQTPLVVRRVVRIFRVVLNASRAQLVDLPMQIADQGGYGVAVIHTREFPGRRLRGLPQGPFGLERRQALGGTSEHLAVVDADGLEEALLAQRQRD